LTGISIDRIVTVLQSVTSGHEVVGGIGGATAPHRLPIAVEDPLGAGCGVPLAGV